MSISRVTRFWDALKELSYAEMMEVCDEISVNMYAEQPEEIDAVWVAQALSETAKSKATPAKRGG